MALRFHGRITVSELKIVLLQALAECPEAVGFDMINDGRDLLTEPAMGEVVRLAAMKRDLGLHERRRRCVGLVAKGSQSGFLQMLQLLTEDTGVARLTTDSIDEAADWLCRSNTVVRSELDALKGATRSQEPRDIREE